MRNSTTDVFGKHKRRSTWRWPSSARTLQPNDQQTITVAPTEFRRVRAICTTAWKIRFFFLFFFKNPHIHHCRFPELKVEPNVRVIARRAVIDSTAAEYYNNSNFNRTAPSSPNPPVRLRALISRLGALSQLKCELVRDGVTRSVMHDA